MRIVIIDDEEKARKTIFNYVSLYSKDNEVVGQADSIATAYKLIVDKKPDLVLLDINMPDGTGFDLLKLFPAIAFKLIFITAYEEFAIKAFKFCALDYLLKPVNPQELIEAIEKAARAISNDHVELKFQTFLNNYDDRSKPAKKLVLKTAESIFVVDIKDIVRCEADGSYTTFYINDNRKIVVSRNLKEYEDQLSEFNFFRPHHSHLVNLEYMFSFEKRDGGSILMKDKTLIPVSTRRKEELLRLFDKL